MTQDSVTLRLARLFDAKFIAVMSRDLIETGLGWSWHPDRVAKSIRDRNSVTLIAEDRERIVAFAIMHFGDDSAHLSLLAVRATHQRQGIGKRMVEWLIGSARVAGIATIQLELRTGNTSARRFYRALGFSETAYIPGYYRGRETALRMLCILREPTAPLPQWQMPRLPRR